MAESRAKRLQLVLQLAQKAEDDAASRVREQAGLLQNEKIQLQELKDYSGQYLNSYANMRDGVSAHQMINYSGFIGRLADAIKDQENKIQRVQEGLDKLKSQWSIAHQKRKALEDLIERLKKEHSNELEKRLQKELDELANRPNGLC